MTIRQSQLKSMDLIIQFDFQKFENRRFEIVLNNLNSSISRKMGRYFKKIGIEQTKQILKNFLKQQFEPKYFLNLVTYLAQEFRKPSCLFANMVSISDRGVYSRFLGRVIDEYYVKAEGEESEDVFDACSEEEETGLEENEESPEMTASETDKPGSESNDLETGNLSEEEVRSDNKEGLDQTKTEEAESQSLECQEDVKTPFYNLSYEYITDILVDQMFDENLNNISEYFVSGEKNGILLLLLCV